MWKPARMLKTEAVRMACAEVKMPARCRGGWIAWRPAGEAVKFPRYGQAIRARRAWVALVALVAMGFDREAAAAEIERRSWGVLGAPEIVDVAACRLKGG